LPRDITRGGFLVINGTRQSRPRLVDRVDAEPARNFFFRRLARLRTKNGPLNRPKDDQVSGGPISGRSGNEGPPSLQPWLKKSPGGSQEIIFFRSAPFCRVGRSIFNRTGPPGRILRLISGQTNPGLPRNRVKEYFPSPMSPILLQKRLMRHFCARLDCLKLIFLRQNSMAHQHVSRAPASNNPNQPEAPPPLPRSSCAAPVPRAFRPTQSDHRCATGRRSGRPCQVLQPGWINGSDRPRRSPAGIPLVNIGDLNDAVDNVLWSSTLTIAWLIRRANIWRQRGGFSPWVVSFISPKFKRRGVVRNASESLQKPQAIGPNNEPGSSGRSI